METHYGAAGQRQQTEKHSNDDKKTNQKTSTLAKAVLSSQHCRIVFVTIHFMEITVDHKKKRAFVKLYEQYPSKRRMDEPQR